MRKTQELDVKQAAFQTLIDLKFWPSTVEESKQSYVCKFFNHIMNETTTHLKFKKGTPFDEMKALINACPNLKSLDLGAKPELAQHFLKALGNEEINVSNLTKLNLAGLTLPDTDSVFNQCNLKNLAKLSTLKSLDLSGSFIKETDFLKELVQLSHLSLGINNPDILARVGELRCPLQSLDLTYHEYINNNTDRENDFSVLTNFSELKNLSLYFGGTLIPDFLVISCLTQLKTLRMKSALFQASVLIPEQTFSTLNNLEVLDLYNLRITNTSVLTNLKNLRALKLVNCEVGTNYSTLSEDFKHLTELSLNLNRRSGYRPFNYTHNKKKTSAFQPSAWENAVVESEKYNKKM